MRKQRSESAFKSDTTSKQEEEAEKEEEEVKEERESSRRQVQSDTFHDSFPAAKQQQQHPLAATTRSANWRLLLPAGNFIVHPSSSIMNARLSISCPFAPECARSPTSQRERERKQVG